MKDMEKKKIKPFYLVPIMIVCLLLLAGIIGFLYKKNTSQPEIAIRNLKVCHLTNPLGIDEEVPTFSWQMTNGKRGAMQTAYRITVAESKDALGDEKFLWDSGKITGSHSVGISYNGDSLLPKMRYYWSVTVWDENDTPYTASEEAWFETGLMGGSMSDAKWISASSTAPSYTHGNDSRVYEITYDMEVTDTTAGFVFGAKEGEYGHLYVCAIKSKADEALFSLHEMQGEYLSTQEADITHIAGGSSHFAVTLSVDNETLSVTINGTPVGDFSIQSTPVGSIGYYKSRSNSFAYLDNLLITDEAGNTLYQEDFESETTIFAPYYVTTENGRLRIKSGMVLTPGYESPAPLFRKEFETADKTIQSARLYMTALGSFSASVNGSAVADDYFSPGKLAYNQQLTYVTYDITSLLLKGSKNVLGLTLLHGWYDRAVGYPEIYSPWGDTNALKGMIEICYEDGTYETIVTDESFLCHTNGPVRSDDIYQGQFYDANYEQTGFDTVAYTAGNDWLPAATNAVDAGYDTLPLTAKENEPIVCIKELTPISVSEPTEGVYVYDFGENIVGTVRLHLTGSQGDVITLRYGEELNTETLANADDAPGTIWTKNLLTAKATDYYVMKGNAEGETFEPKYTFHGFRYMQVTGVDKAPSAEEVCALVLSSGLTQTGSFSCSNELLNQYYENTIRSQQGNFLDSPTDCPQRDERHGWAGDAQIFSLTASYHKDTYNFYRKYLEEMRLLQTDGGSFPDMAPRNFGADKDGRHGTGSNNCWGDAPVVITWNLYQQFGDIAIVEENYDALCKWVDVLAETSEEYIRFTNGYGDHLSLESTPADLSDTAWCARSAQLVSKMATALGKTEDAEYYASVYEKYKKAWQDAYIIWETGAIECYSQTAFSLGLAFDLYPEELKESAANCLITNLEAQNYQMKAGFSGIGYLLPALSENGKIDAAYRLLLQEEAPSLLYQVKKGATTTWEQWTAYSENGDGTYTLDGSLNHYAYGTPASFLYTDVLGIRSDEHHPGYKHFFLEPQATGALSHANGSYDSIYGTISVSYAQTENGYEYHFEVPANTTATLSLPALSENQTYLESGKEISGDDGVKFVGIVDNKAIYELSSGSFSFTASGS